MNPNNLIPMTPEQYADEWEKSSKQYEIDKNYDWLNEQLGVANQILEIGCGSGQSTLTLVKANRKVVVIEINDTLIEKTIKYLKNENVSVTQVYNLNEINTLSDYSVIIFKANFLTLNSNSFKNRKFDGIICWQIGAAPLHISQSINKDIYQFIGTEMQDYRILIQSHLYKIAHDLLNENGKTQISDRGMIDSWQSKNLMRNQIIEFHKTISKNSHLFSLDNTWLRKLKTLKASHINYVVQELPTDASNVTFFLSSIVAQKIN